MAKKKRARRKQGLVSWATSIIALGIGSIGIFQAVKAGGFAGLTNKATGGIAAGRAFSFGEAMEIYGPMIAAIVFKKFASELTKSVRIQSLVPRLG